MIQNLAICFIVWCGGVLIGIAGTLFAVRRTLKKENLW